MTLRHLHTFTVAPAKAGAQPDSPLAQPFPRGERVDGPLPSQGRRGRVRPTILALCAVLAPLAAPPPAAAQFVFPTPWKLVRAGEVRKVGTDEMLVTAVGDWNRSTQSELKRNESWTQHGTGLDDLSFYGGIVKGKPLLRQRDKKKDPLPKFDPAMLPTDIAEWFESSARIALNSAVFEVGAVRPATLAGTRGVEMDYTYATEGDNLERQGIARAAVVGGKLYVISFDAPKIHYYRAGLATALAIMDSARVVAKAK